MTPTCPPLPLELAATRPGRVWLVGAGPGDPDLLTLRAARVIGEADVLLVDDLVDRRVLALAAPGARLLAVGKRGGCASTDQRFIHAVMIREARAGRRVVRLKGGDPFVFGRGGEECDALRAEGVEVEVVPGITAGIAAPMAAGIPVTDRRCAPGVAFVTGQVQDGGRGPNWEVLAASGLTLVVYMGVATAGRIAERLMAAGRRADTPAAVVSAAHTPSQRHHRTRLADLACDLQRLRVESPAILVIGEVAALGEAAMQAQLAPGRYATVPPSAGAASEATEPGSADLQPGDRRVGRRIA
jgi:uroporphyrin-III C-methyltransferase